MLINITQFTPKNQPKIINTFNGATAVLTINNQVVHLYISLSYVLMNSGILIKYYCNEYTRRRLRNKFTNPKKRNNEGQDQVASDKDNLKKYHELLEKAEREQDPIEKVSLEQRAEYFRKLAQEPIEDNQ